MPMHRPTSKASQRTAVEEPDTTKAEASAPASAVAQAPSKGETASAAEPEMTPAERQGAHVIAQELAQRKERARRRRNQLYSRLPSAHPAAQILSYSEDARELFRCHMSVQGVRPRLDSDPPIPPDAPPYSRTGTHFHAQLAGYSEMDLTHQLGKLLQQVFPNVPAMERDANSGAPVPSRAFTQLIASGQLRISENEQLACGPVMYRNDREAYNVGCRMLVKEFSRLVGRLYVKKVELAAGYDLTADNTLGEASEHEARYCMSMPVLAGYMVAYEYEGNFYLGASVVSDKDRMAGKLDRNREIWHAIRNSLCPQEVSARNELAHRAGVLRDQFLAMRRQLLNYHIDDVLNGVAKRAVEAQANATSAITNEIISQRPSNARWSVAKITELRGQLSEANKAKPRRDEAIQSLEEQLTMATTLDEIETEKRQGMLRSKGVITRWSQCDELTAEQAEVMSILNQRLLSEYKSYGRKYAKKMKEAKLNNRPAPKMPDPGDFKPLDQSMFLARYAYDSAFTDLAASMRQDFEVEMRSPAWQPAAARTRMMSPEELVNAIPGWGPHGRSPLLEFYSESRVQHQQFKQAQEAEMQRIEAEKKQTESAQAATASPASTTTTAEGAAQGSGPEAETAEVAAATATVVSEDQHE
jgi:hypothetical protein